LEKCWEKNIDVHLVFINFQPAYDSVWRKEIWSKVHKLGFSKTLVTLCGILNNEIYAKVKIGKHLSFKYKVNKVLNKEMQLLLCCLI
jgi:hypothetical protein